MTFNIFHLCSSWSLAPATSTRGGSSRCTRSGLKEDDRGSSKYNGNGESTDRSSIVPWKGQGCKEREEIEEKRGDPRREERRVGDGFCNGKLPHEKVVKRGRIVAGRKGQGGGGADLNIDVEEQ